MQALPTFLVTICVLHTTWIDLYNDDSPFPRTQRLCPTGHTLPGSCIKLSFSIPTSTPSSITAEITIFWDQHEGVIFGMTGLMFAHRQNTPRSYTCRTLSRVFTFQALTRLCVRSSTPLGMYTSLFCVFPGWLPCSRLSSTAPVCCWCPTVSIPWCPRRWCHI